MDKVRLHGSSWRDMARDQNECCHFERTLGCGHNPKKDKRTSRWLVARCFSENQIISREEKKGRCYKKLIGLYPGFYSKTAKFP